MKQNTALNTALIIFVRNPVAGKVKTRIAKVIGDEKALKVYQLLLNHTQQVTLNLNCRKFVYYADQIDEHDLWSTPGYTKRQQFGNDLGERMSNAFKELFEQGFQKILIIGSDCYQLQTKFIDKAIDMLNTNDVILGPTFDGGYYLLGMKQFRPALFLDKIWSTNQVTKQTLQDIIQLDLSFILLQQLHDVDTPQDLEFNQILSRIV